MKDFVRKFFNHDSYHMFLARCTEALENFSACTETNEKDFSDYAMYVSIDNSLILEHLYDTNLLYEIQKQLSDALEVLFGNGCEVYVFGDLKILLFLKQVHNVKNKVHDLRKLIQNFGHLYSPEPMFLVASFASIKLEPKTPDSLTVIKKLFATHEYLKSNLKGFYLDYDEVKYQLNFTKYNLRQANSLLMAVDESRLRLAFQPITDRTGNVKFYESLMRVCDHQGNIRSAGPLMPVAEQYGFIDRIDELVLELVTQTLKDRTDIVLSFNISAMCIENNYWLKRASRLLKSRPDLSSRIIVEITETAIMRDLGKAAYFVASLQELGCQVALDDYGAGSTSFRQLKALSVDIIKIDGSFIKDIVNNSNNKLFVKILVDMCQGFGIKSVAEYVENSEILKALVALKVDYMQGNFLGAAVNDLGKSNDETDS